MDFCIFFLKKHDKEQDEKNNFAEAMWLNVYVNLMSPSLDINRSN